MVHAVPNHARLPRSGDSPVSIELLQDLREPFDVAPRARGLHKNTPSPRVDASSFSRLNPLRRRMNRCPLLESEFFTAAPPRAFFSRASLARRPQDGRRRLDALARTSWTSSFVLFFPARPHVGRAGPWAPRPSGSERSSSGPSCSPCTVTPTSSSYLPRVSFPSLPSAHKEFAVDS